MHTKINNYCLMYRYLLIVRKWSDWIVSGEVEIDEITALRITAISKFVSR